jgi:FtsP/CotA-like multicopper oxidase with cupredoxin domain
MELQNYYDGVVGLGGMPGQKTRPIAPGGSFDAQMTPPRAGTFIYHTHLMEVRQAQGGLYGAMIVLPKGATWDAEHDHVFVLGANQTELPVVLNGSPAPPVISVAAGSPHRLRLINIATGAPGARFQLVRQDTTLLQWQPLAKDAVDLPAAQRPTKPAAQVVSMGETYDMLATFATPGTYRLEVRSAANVLFTYQTITVVPPAKAP